MDLAVIGVGSRGRDAYMINLKNYKDIRFTALCDKNPMTLDSVRDEYAPDAKCFTDENLFWQAGRLADWIIIATLDKDHYRHIIKALELGYHVMVEKPVTESAEELDEIIALAKERQRKVVVCHVLRYAPYFRSIKEMVSSGTIGDIITIRHEEDIGFWHFAHSYVRGNWRNTDVAAPLPLAKNSHDFDLLYWLIGKECVSISAFGGLRVFKKDNMPEGAAAFCLGGCKAKQSCIYDAEKFYLDIAAGKNVEVWGKGFFPDVIRNGYWSVITNIPNPTEEETRCALQTGAYGRCVYRCDNNVHDHLSVNMLFDGGVTASFTVSAFTREFCRRMHITGTKGEIIGTDNALTYTLNVFCQGSEPVTFSQSSGGHGGGDPGICETLHKIMRGEPVEEGLLTTIDVTAKSHRIAFAAIESVKTGQTVWLK